MCPTHFNSHFALFQIAGPYYIHFFLGSNQNHEPIKALGDVLHNYSDHISNHHIYYTLIIE